MITGSALTTAEEATTVGAVATTAAATTLPGRMALLDVAKTGAIAASFTTFIVS